MSRTELFNPSTSRLRTPLGPPRHGQPHWNQQRGSAMPIDRYARTASRLADPSPLRTWPDRSIDHAPLWASVDLRDGNQALVNPMDPERKGLMFDLLVHMGLKNIEVGYPSSSEADFSFVRELVTGDRIPEDVTISVFTPAKPDLIDRTFEALAGADRATVHLCNATACLWREVVFGLTADETATLATSSAEHMVRRADAMRGVDIRFEYSPETFNVTEPEFALEVCDAVAAICEAAPDRPVIVNLPTTVETDSPNVFADQIEWMHRNLANRESIILSVHPHNDRGTAVASAELAVAAGADRVEGTLFGNGERTGNVCLVTLALNLFSQGIDPQLDLADIDEVRRVVEFCNQLRVPERHPYVGDLVYTAFSGTHQDAIAKGLAAMGRTAERLGGDTGKVPWEVPYLPIDPKDVGRTYESVVRLNSQSGKGGIAYVLKTEYGFDLPKPLRTAFARTMQRVADHAGELNAAQVLEVFQDEFVNLSAPMRLASLEHGGADDVRATVAAEDREIAVTGGVTELATELGAHLDDITTQSLVHGGEPCAATYVSMTVGGAPAVGAGLDRDPIRSAVKAVISAVNRTSPRAGTAF